MGESGSLEQAATYPKQRCHERNVCIMQLSLLNLKIMPNFSLHLWGVGVVQNGLTTATL